MRVITAPISAFAITCSANWGIDQDNVGAGCLEPEQAFMERGARRLQVIVAQCGVGADLPQDEIGLFGEHGLVETSQHVDGFYAIRIGAIERREK